MRVVHTSDWHLGHRLHEQSQHEEHILFLDWLYRYIVDNRVDLLLISGDIFDTSVPSTQSQKLYYDFLIKVKDSCCSNIVITGGNHDSPGTLDAPKQLLQALSVDVVGKASENPEDEVLNLSIADEKVTIAAVPYLRDQDIRRAVAGETFDQVSDRYRTALISHFKEVADRCTQENVKICMGHLFAVGGAISDSEQSIYVGGLGDIRSSEFPETFDYIALGHLHKAQKVNSKENIRYSGSPIILSFSEAKHQKCIVTIDIEDNNISAIEDVAIPRFREILKLKGSTESVLDQLKAISSNSYGLTPWVEIVLEKGSVDSHQIQTVADPLELKVLKITSSASQQQAGLETLVKSIESVKELSPIQVFKMKCKEEKIDLEKNSDLLDRFNEVLQQALDN